MARNDVNIRVGADTRGLDNSLKRAEAQSEGFARRLGGVYRKVTGGLNRAIANPFTALVGGAAILKATNDLVQFDSRLTRLAIQGRMSAKEQMTLRDSIIETGLAAGQSREDVLSGLDAIVQRTGDLDFARSVMHDMAVASTATGAGMEDLGALASNLQQKMGLAREEIAGAFNLLTVQGKAGAFTLENMASMGERLFAAAGRFGVKGMEGISQFGALTQMARMGTGSSEQATTAIEGALTDIIDKRKEIAKQAGGFQIFKPGTANELKSIDEIFKGIIRGTGGDAVKLQKIFGRESIRGVSAMAQAYKETGGFEMFDRLAAGGNPDEIMQDFARYSEEAAFQFARIKGLGVDLASSVVGPVLRDLNGWARELLGNKGRMDALRDGFKEIGTVISGGAELLRPVIAALDASAKGWMALLDKFAAERNLRQVQEERRDRTVSGLNALPADMRKQIMSRVTAGEKVNVEYEVMRYQTRQKLAAENNITMNVNIDGQGRVKTDVDDLHTKVQVNANRGDLAYGF